MFKAECLLVNIFIQALLLVCDWELAEARKKDALDRARVRGEEPPAELLAEERGLHTSVVPDVKRLLQGKTHTELEALEVHIESEMRTGTAKVVEYWEAVLKHLQIYKAKVISIIFFFPYVMLHVFKQWMFHPIMKLLQM